MTTPTDAVTLLETARPADLDAADPDVRERVYRAAIARPSTVTPDRQSHGRRLVIPVVGAGALAIAVVVALGVQLVRPGTTPAHPTAPASTGPAHSSPPGASTGSASAVLLAAADAVEKSPNPTVGRYWNTNTLIFQLGNSRSPSSTVFVDHWIARSPNEQSWLSMGIAGGPGHLQAAGSAADDPLDALFDVEDRFLTYAQLQQVPSNPEALRAYVLAIPQDHPNLPPEPVSDRLFGACSALAQTPVSPAVRAASFRLLAGLPNLTAVGEVTDPLGRLGVAVVATFTGGTAVELIIDPTTGAMLSLENVSGTGGDATVSYSETLVSEEWTNVVTAP